jgi:hypothetical protein
MTGTGLAGWRIEQVYRDSDSFDQDLLIKEITNFKDRVWFSSGAVKRTQEDADECWILTSLSMKKYKDIFPKGSGKSVQRERYSDPYLNTKSDEVVIGEKYYKVREDRLLVKMSNDSVYVVDDEFNQIRDELFSQGIQVVDERKREVVKVRHQIFDGSDWLNDSRDTVFQLIPVVPVYGNFTVSYDKIVYWGIIEKLMDAQRVLNYSESKKTAESALKPVEKIWLTKGQAKSPDVKKTLRTQNTNADPVQFYDDVPGVNPPFIPQGKQVDGVLVETAASSKQYLKEAANIFDASRGQGLSGQSGETVRLLQNKGNASNYKYIHAMEVAVGHTAKILIKAYPKVYNKRQELRIVNEDGTVGSFLVRQIVQDQQTGDLVEINDISKGTYSVVCEAGPAYHNRQEQTVTQMGEVAALNPEIMQIGSDIFAKNMAGPGLDQVAERLRRMKLQQGVIPKEQWTDKDKEFMAAIANQPQEPDPAAKIADAELERVQAETIDTISKINERQEKAQQGIQKMMLDFQEKQQKADFERQQQLIDMMKENATQLKTQVETLAKIKEVLGADGIIGPKLIDAFDSQVNIVKDEQITQ